MKTAKSATRTKRGNIRRRAASSCRGCRGCGKNGSIRHSERSEESLFGGNQEKRDSSHKRRAMQNRTSLRRLRSEGRAQRGRAPRVKRKKSPAFAWEAKAGRGCE